MQKYSEHKNNLIRARAYFLHYSCETTVHCSRASPIRRKAETVHVFFAERSLIGQPLGDKWL